MVEESIRVLKHLRDGYSEEEPDVVLHSDSQVATKWRFPGWAQAIANELDLLEDGGYINSHLREMIDRYESRLKGRGWKEGRGFKLAEREDIDFANAFLEEIIPYLESRALL